MKLKKALLIFSIFCLGVFITGCGCKKNSNSGSKNQASLTNNNESKNQGQNGANKEENKKLGSLVTAAKVENQFKKPEKGEEIVVISVKDYGKIKCKLFPEVAPNSIKNFKEFAKAGRYNSGTFHRIIKDFMIQTGKEADEKGDLKNSPVELNQTLRHFNGALCMARNYSKTQGQGCQFYIVSSEQGKKADFDSIKRATDESYKAEGLNISVNFDDKTKKLYKEHGGRPDLDMLYTVIGQVYEGQDVVDKIAATPVKEQEGQDAQKEKSQPEKPPVVEKVEIVKVE